MGFELKCKYCEYEWYSKTTMTRGRMVCCPACNNKFRIPQEAKQLSNDIIDEIRFVKILIKKNPRGKEIHERKIADLKRLGDRYYK